MGYTHFFAEFCLANLHREEKYISPTSFAYNSENSGFKESDEIKAYDDDNVIQNTFSFIGQRIFHAKRFCLAFA